MVILRAVAMLKGEMSKLFFILGSANAQKSLNPNPFLAGTRLTPLALLSVPLNGEAKRLRIRKRFISVDNNARTNH